MASSGTFKIQFALKRALDDGAVFKKQDGGRFNNSVTVKLNAETKYLLTITIRPVRILRQVQINASRLGVIRQKPEDNHDNCCVYQAEWSTIGCDVCKSSSRADLPIAVEVGV